MTHPSVSRLLVYPIKSLDPVAVDPATVLPSGALQGDREFALFDAAGNFVNGKRHAGIHRLRAEWRWQERLVSLGYGDRPCPETFHLDRDQSALERWFSEYFGFVVQLRRNPQRGFPDDTESPGPTVISTATLGAIAAWYPNQTEDEMRRRFRANIEIDGVPAFWEDQLFATDGETQSFQIGDVQVEGVNPCQRCVVVTRDAGTGTADANFQRIFVQHRRETLPDWTERSRFNHFFRLAINTRIPASEAGKLISLGDAVSLA